MDLSSIEPPAQLIMADSNNELLLSGWELASSIQCSDETVLEVLRLLRTQFPVRGILVYYLDALTQNLIRVGASLPNRGALESATIPCTDAKWTEMARWCESGELLRQPSPRRSGKLALLAPESISGEALAIPLRTNRSQPKENEVFGAVVMEIELGRTLRDEQLGQMERWNGPLWLMLSNTFGRINQTSRTTDNASVGQGGEQKKSENIVGADSGLKSVMERVQLVAPADMPVLILGDTGTGKEVVARAIHLRSPRASKPFIRVNCGAIPPELIDSQLFGHERGSFTGASDQRKGWFERANGGTLFLDEIGELPLAAQVRLLRVLQEHQIERVGGQDSFHVDVRIVAATHRDLATMVHERTFREDLWYRINMFPILLPRLYERVEDIPALAKHFAKKASSNFGFPYVEPGPSEIKQLIEYRWPGNIRELQAVIDRAVILGRGIKLDIANALGLGIAQRYEPVAESDEPTFYEVIPESIAKPIVVNETARREPEPGRIDSLDEAMRRHIERALLVTNGQIEGKRGAAQILNINPHTLRAKMRKLGIDWDAFRNRN